MDYKACPQSAGAFGGHQHSKFRVILCKNQYIFLESRLVLGCQFVYVLAWRLFFPRSDYFLTKIEFSSIENVVFQYEELILRYMLLYKVCLSHQYLQFEPNFNIVGQFWKFYIEIGSLGKKGSWGTPNAYQNNTKRITRSLPPRGSQISLGSKYWKKTQNVSHHIISVYEEGHSAIF